MAENDRLIGEDGYSSEGGSDVEGSLQDGSGPLTRGTYAGGRRSRQVQFHKLPWGIWLLEKLGLCGLKTGVVYKGLILVLTFCCYTTYHLTRKSISVVKVMLHPEDSDPNENCTYPGWDPFEGNHGKTLLGTLDYTWLFAYAICMFFSGQIADRTNLRYFLTFGMTGSAIFVGLLGVTYFANIHYLWYFIIVQIFGGALQSTGWPGNVAVMSHWFGKNKRGLIMGIWNSHTSVGNILGTIIPSFWVDCNDDAEQWGWSFIVPSFIMLCVALTIFLFLVNDPSHVGLPPPVHHLDGDVQGEERHQIIVEQNGQQRVTTNGTPGAVVSVYTTATNVGPAPDSRHKPKAVNFLTALLIPGVIEYALALFFNKLVSYTFLFWLPLYIKSTKQNLSGQESAWLSTLFDVGGIIGGITAGLVSDLIKARAITCVASLLLAVPSLFFLRSYGSENLAVFIVLLIICGLFINGPYGMITTAVSSDLGTHKTLRGNQNAKATVTAIIDGTGSIGAAFGPLIFGLVADDLNYDIAFYILMTCCFVSALFLSRLIFTEVIAKIERFRPGFNARTGGLRWCRVKRAGYESL